MISLKNLQHTNPEVKELLCSSKGYALWTVWQGGSNQVVRQTLEDYGGIRVLGDSEQALWFFFTPDVFLAVAKLMVWAKFNSLPMTAQILGGELKVSPQKGMRIDLKPEAWTQSVAVPAKFQVFVTQDVLRPDGTIAGISLNKVETPKGFFSSDWFLIQADQRLPYKSELSWYAVLNPVGNPLDKGYLVGWRDFYNHIDGILQRNKFRYTINGNFVMIPLESLRQLQAWCLDYLSLLSRLKSEHEDKGYWPTVMAIMERRNYTFNNDLPNHFHLDWSMLEPDQPHLSLRDALLLDGDFQINPVRFAMGSTDPQAWCNVSLASDRAEDNGSMPGMTPSALVFGPHKYCFYCGQRSHLSADCPSKRIEKPDDKIWNRIASLDYKSMQVGIGEINARLTANPESLEELLKADNAPGQLVKAIFSIDATVQLRSAPIFWRVKGNSYPEDKENLMAEDDSPIWQFYHDMHNRDLLTMEKELKNLQVRLPRDYRVYSLRGFVAVEREDYVRADECWKQAYLLSHPGLMQSWHLFLQARLVEHQGRYQDAYRAYDKVLEITPSWREAEYRKLVCLVKGGFIGMALPMIDGLVRRNPDFFNWMLLDPELERGYLQILQALHTEWVVCSQHLEEERGALQSLIVEMSTWFTPGHPFLAKATDQIKRYIGLSEVQNYVPFQMVLLGRNSIERDMQKTINSETKTYKDKFNGYVQRLAAIRDEAAWFPFPRALVDFNRNYNASAANINWVLRSNMHVPEVFKKAQEFTDREDERITRMERRIKFLRIIRDGTLFSLVVTRRFLWIELVGLAAILALLPLAIYYAGKMDLGWFSEVFVQQQWEIQKGAILVVSLVAIAVSGLWTVLRFEAIREKTFAKARLEEEKRSRQRADQMARERKVRAARRKANASGGPGKVRQGKK